MILLDSKNGKLILHVWRSCAHEEIGEFATEFVVHYRDENGNLDQGYYTSDLMKALKEFNRRLKLNNWGWR